MLCTDGRATDDEQVDSGIHDGLVKFFGALRAESTGNGHSSFANFREALRDELWLDRLRIQLLHTNSGLIGGKTTNLFENRLGVFVAGPEALEVEHSETAELAHRNSCCRRDHGVHGSGNHGNVEGVGVNCPAHRDVARVARTARRHNSDVIKGVHAASAFGTANFEIIHYSSLPRRR